MKKSTRQIQRNKSIDQKSKLKNFAAHLIKLLKRYYPDAHCALDHKNPEELLIATILSAQCTDERVNKVTGPLFKKYPTPKHFAQADLQELEDLIHSTGFYKNKAKNIQSCCTDLVTKFDSKVPQHMDHLVKLAGVGKKTANVVLGNSFGIASGVVVDTHVSRLSKRLGLTNKKTPEQIEEDLKLIVPKKHWIQFSHWLITHGRLVCKARKPQCHECFLQLDCPQILN